MRRPTRHLAGLAVVLAGRVAVRPQADAHAPMVQLEDVVVELHVSLVNLVEQLQVVRR